MRVITKGQVAIPKEIRDQLSIEIHLGGVKCVADQNGARIAPIRPAQTLGERARHSVAMAYNVASIVDFGSMATD